MLCSGQLQNPSGKDPIWHLLTAAKTESEQNAFRARRKGKIKKWETIVKTWELRNEMKIISDNICKL